MLYPYTRDYIARGFSALQRAEIAETGPHRIVAEVA